MTSRRILFVVTEDWFFLSHFRYMAEAAREAGFQVTVAARAVDGAARIRALGFEFAAIDVARSAMGPVALAHNVRALAQTMRAAKPDLVHLVALRPILLGAVACRVVPRARVVAAPTGLGYAWSNDGPKARFIRQTARAAVRSIRRRDGAFIFENGADAAEFGLRPGMDTHVVVVPGAGVDPGEFPLREMPPRSGPLKVVVVARLLRSKGIVEAADAVGLARDAGSDVTLDIYGAPDPDNPESLTQADLETLNRRPGVHWHGRTNDVAGVLGDAHVLMLLSRYREGLPRSLIEGAAAGRVLIATDMPGCRDVVLHGRNGYIVPVVTAAEAAAAHLVTLARDRDLVERLGIASRQVFADGFTRERVCREVVALYDRLMEERVSSRTT